MAIDLGYRVVVLRHAACQGDDETHDATGSPGRQILCPARPDRHGRTPPVRSKSLLRNRSAIYRVICSQIWRGVVYV